MTWGRGDEARVKRGVRLYPGRRVVVEYVHTFPNGRVEVRVRLKAGRGRAGWMHHDVRGYAPDELEPVAPGK